MGVLATSINLMPDSTFFFQLLLFIAAIGILNWGIFTPVMRVLDLRKRKTIGDSTEAADILARAESLATQYTDKIREARLQSHAIKEELRQVGFAKATELMNAARSEALAELDKARKTITLQVEAARKTLADEANVFALAIAAKLAPQEKSGSSGFVEENNGVSE
ncbi:MAG: hypothetical protein COV45_00680 [Deltaproteobacteria bacterium CG11_big_fil_rev_8_21_14_0_20_47_16]|nr:MAG: hypothetical protein COV45_00680 [Deltaproteobacteria bacterium CG11_big_fil_rev_8_21_14_0_20_47_16]